MSVGKPFYRAAPTNVPVTTGPAVVLAVGAVNADVEIKDGADIVWVQPIDSVATDLNIAVGSLVVNSTGNASLSYDSSND